MSMAIYVKYLPSTNTKPARIKAIARKKSNFAPEMSVTVSSDVGVGHAAKLCAEKYGWFGHYVRGDLDNGDWVFVNVNRSAETFTLIDDRGE